MKKIMVKRCVDCDLRYVDEGVSYCILTQTSLPYRVVVNGETYEHCRLLKESIEFIHVKQEKKK